MKLEFIDIETTSLKKEFIKSAVDFFKKKLIEKKIIAQNENRKLVIAFLSQEAMIQLNSKFRDKNQVTDVLSFSPVEDGGLGELALCIPQIQAQAQKEGLTLEEEVVYLILHGVLHLLGYHHEEEGEPARLMYEIQDDIFAQWQSHYKVSF